MAAGEWSVRWRAPFIWYRQPPRAGLFAEEELEDEHRDAFVLMRRRVDLDAVPASAPSRVTADGRYILWVNGIEVSRGPVRSEPGCLHWDEVDLAPHLHRGPNAVCLLVRHYGVATPWWSPAEPYGDLGRGGVALEVGPLPTLDTSGRWRVMRGPWRHAQRRLVFGAPNEDIDGRLMPRGWLETSFDDGAWDAATVLGTAVHWGSTGSPPPATPFTLIEARSIPPQTDDIVAARPLHRAVSVGDFTTPASRVLVADPVFARGALGSRVPGDVQLPVDLDDGQAVVFDFGRMVVGLPRVTVDAGPGVSVTLRSGEELLDGAVHDPFRFWAHRRTCAGGPEVLEPFEVAGMRYLSVSADGPSRVLGVELRERRYAYTSMGELTCDDPGLTDIWRLGVRTLELCSTDAYLDCPGREQRAWLGDFYVHAMVNYVASADTGLAARALRMAARTVRPDGLLGMIAAGDFARHTLTLSDYSLHWIRALARYHQHTGDTDLVEELLPVAQGILAWYRRYVEDDVLMPIPGWVFVDWWPLMGDVPLATLHGLLALAAADHAALATLVDQPRVSARSGALAAQLHHGFRHFMAGGRVFEEVERGTMTQHAAAVAVLIGAVEGREAGDLLESVVDDAVVRYPVEDPAAPHSWALPPDWDPRRHVLAAQPFFCHWLHQAMATAGRQDLLLQSIRRWQPYTQTGDDCIAEFWPGRTQRGSHAHAWSATPTYDLTAHMLGVRPLEPGYRRVEVAPWWGPLHRLRGRIPTPAGFIDVALRRSPDGVRGTIELPDGVTGIVYPDGRANPGRPLEKGVTEVG